MNNTVSVHTVSQYLDLTPRRVQALAKAGIIPKVSRGRYELIPALHGYIQYLRGVISTYTGYDGASIDDLMPGDGTPGFDPLDDIPIEDIDLSGFEI